MKKHAIFLGAFLSSGIAFSQVGINTPQPKATLDIMASSTDLTKTDGLIAPRLKGSELKAKDALYTSAQVGTMIYVTEALTAFDTTPKTINVSTVGYFYFDGIVWQKVGQGATAPIEPWYNQATSNQATSNTQNIYQTGKVSIGKNISNGLLSVYDPYATANTTPFYLEYVSQLDNTKNPFLTAVGNVGTGSFSSLSIGGDQALVFSVDGDPNIYTRNSLELIPHVNGGGAAPFGFKITEQGMFSFNAQYPTETLDLGRGTARIRNLPLSGSTNSIYTTPSGQASLPISTDINGLAATQPFTATRTVVADANGVLGYVEGAPSTAVNNDATRYLGGTVYVIFNSIASGTLITTKVIGSATGVAYSLGTASAISSKGGINFIKGNGYTISNPSAGIFDIKFDTPLTDIYGISSNIIDSYTSSSTVPMDTAPGTRLFTNDNSQVAYISNTIIRIKTGDSNGSLSNRSFTFLVTGK